jgi:formate/nitrite transporter FocA (FNT family)
MNMKLNKNKAITIVFICSLLIVGDVSAAGYVTKEIIPGEAAGTNDFMSYLNSLYNFGIGISALLAVFMIGFGAFKYTVFSAGNASTMGDAKETIYSAIFGLGLALTAWLVLNIINPDLINNTMQVEPVVRQQLEMQASH